MAPAGIDAIFLHGRGDFRIDVVGVARHLAELREVVGGRLQVGESRPYVARLILREREAHAKEAVAIAIEDRVVGYCPAHLATRYREWLRTWRIEHAVVSCRATITCMQKEPGFEDRYVVRLDLELPFKMTTISAPAREP